MNIDRYPEPVYPYEWEYKAFRAAERGNFQEAGTLWNEARWGYLDVGDYEMASLSARRAGEYFGRYGDWVLAEDMHYRAMAYHEYAGKVNVARELALLEKPETFAWPPADHLWRNLYRNWKHAREMMGLPDDGLEPADTRPD